MEYLRIIGKEVVYVEETFRTVSCTRLNLSSCQGRGSHNFEEETVEITEIRVTLRNEERLKGFANITFDNSFVVRGMKIIEGNNGLFVSMPSRKRPNGTYQDIAHPIHQDMREDIESQVLKEYQEEVKRNSSN